MNLSTIDPGSGSASDGELLNAISRGERRDMQQLYLEYQRRLTRFPRRFTRRQESIEEMVDDTFVVVRRKAQGFQWESQVSSRISDIADRTTLKSVCKTRRESARSAGKHYDETVDPALETETRHWLASGLTRLPVEPRLALELACHIANSLTEGAVITGAPIGAAKTRLLFLCAPKLCQYLPTVGGLCQSSPHHRQPRVTA
jgi:RNA polymerase sigma-70 factor, ECF subfamily